MAEQSLVLAYDAAKSTLAQQDSTLATVRNRATAVLTAGSIAVTFSSAVGLVSGDGKLVRQYPTWIAVLLLLVMIGLGYSAMKVLWPVSSWAFGPSAQRILKLHDESKSEDEIRRDLADLMIRAAGENSTVIVAKQKWLRIAVVLLLIEVLLVVLAFLLA